MAENKKSFILYADFIHAFEGLEDVEAGILIKHILRYVNDLNPICPDKITKVAFEPIKQQLKRDLVKYEGKKVQWSEAGKASAEARKIRSTNPTDVNDRSNRSTVSTVTVNDTVNVNDIYIKFSEMKIWIDSVCMSNKLTEQQVQIQLKKFIFELSAKEDLGKTDKEIKQHFVNWLKFNPISENKDFRPMVY